jgi:hypothetical protein
LIAGNTARFQKNSKWISYIVHFIRFFVGDTSYKVNYVGPV